MGLKAREVKMTKGMNGKIREEIKALEKYLTSLDKVMRQHDK